jgi:hypothetical protein
MTEWAFDQIISNVLIIKYFFISFNNKKVFYYEIFNNFAAVMLNKFFIVFIALLLGVVKNVPAKDIFHTDEQKTSKLSISESIIDVLYKKGKNSKHPNVSERFIKNNVIPNQIREFGHDLCNEVSSYCFETSYIYLIKLFTSKVVDVNHTSLPFFKLFNNYRL